MVVKALKVNSPYAKTLIEATQKILDNKKNKSNISIEQRQDA